MTGSMKEGETTDTHSTGNNDSFSLLRKLWAQGRDGVVGVVSPSCDGRWQRGLHCESLIIFEK